MRDERLTARCETRCTPEEKEHWRAFAEARSLRLSDFMRLVLNNATLRNDPPEMAAFSDADIARYTGMTVTEQQQRAKLPGRPLRRRLPGGLALLYLLVIATTTLQVVEMIVYH